MSTQPTDPGTAGVRKDLLARLGLADGADEQSVRAAHRSIVEYLDQAPDDIGRWAKRRKQEADRVLSLLTGPQEALVPLAKPAPVAPRAGGVGTRVPKLVWVLIGLAALVGLVWGVYQLGNTSGNVPAMTAAQGTTAAAVPTVDAAQLAQLMAKVQANPQDAESLQAIANLYYNANDYKNARVFLDKILAFDPKNEKALIGSGAAAYNAGDYAGALKVLNTAAGYYPANAEIHYDLGFVYMMTGETEKMQAEWAQVVKLAPDSQMATNVQQHVGGVKSSASPSAPAPAPTPAAPSATPTK